MKTWKETISVLTDEQKQLLADTIVYGSWGSTEMEFANETNDDYVTDVAYGYITNDAKQGGHFSGRKVSAMFRAIYRKLETMKGAGQITAHYNNWWGDGSGDVMFIRKTHDDDAWKWAEEYNKNNQ